MPSRFKIKLGFLIVLILIVGFLAYANFRNERNGILTVAFLNIGQGDSIFIDAPNGNQLLIDGGPGKSVLRELSKIMPFYDRSIDVVLATHPDADHTSGLNDVLDEYKVNLFLEPGVEGETNIYKALKQRVEAKNIKTVEARRGMRVDLGEGATLEILFPVLDPEGMETNTASIVARLVYGENEFMLTGDSPQNIEEYLVATESAYLKSDVLKAGHHGSKTSTGESFVKAVSPQYAVISAGKDNKYGHPNKETLDTLSKFGAQILRTDQSGQIVFKSDGVNLEIKLSRPILE